MQTAAAPAVAPEKSETAHTPGPWMVTTGRESVYALMNDPDRPSVQINRFHANIQGAFCPREEKEANARLIAAAPELFNALTEIVADLQFSKVQQHINLVKLARAALAKAKGGAA
jgi:hypothetical protein